MQRIDVVEGGVCVRDDEEVVQQVAVVFDSSLETDVFAAMLGALEKLELVVG